jgi:hypothetical protein
LIRRYQFQGAALKIKDIMATGTGVKIREAEIQGEISIEDVRAGYNENIPKS